MALPSVGDPHVFGPPGSGSISQRYGSIPDPGPGFLVVNLEPGFVDKKFKQSTTENFVIMSNFCPANGFPIDPGYDTASLWCNVCSKYALDGHYTTNVSTPTFQTT
jgi:hypothetical protein